MGEDWQQYAREVQAASNAGYDRQQKRIKQLEAEVLRLENACKAWSNVSQRNYRRAKEAEKLLAEAKP